MGGGSRDDRRRAETGRHQKSVSRAFDAGQRLPRRIHRQRRVQPPLQIDFAPRVEIRHRDNAARARMQHQHLVPAGHCKRSIRHVVVGIVNRQRFEVFDAARKIHRAIEQQLKLRGQMHMGIHRRAIVKTKTQRLGPAVFARQQHLAGKGNPLGSAALPGQLCGIDDVTLHWRNVTVM